ncbi:MAG: DNA-formamidopyrimidine glycosylase [Phycisphaeraceae bacterium]|nr:DNA-formamidopyrimidine glycosylase [Phycisphaeraceae bacterium]|tara:strand:- start:5033 stop:5875 length:843 start_codon:yes stop_codon:yes gene_type:complete
MPELPEVENVRTSLRRKIVGQKITHVSVHRPDIIRGPSKPRNMLSGCQIKEVGRYGKQLAIYTENNGSYEPCICIHLGMTGSLRYEPTSGQSGTQLNHIHVTWRFSDGGTFFFRDPRRFGGIWTFPTPRQLRDTRWQHLGPDAVTITAMQLTKSLRNRSRNIKSALLDQGIVAGLGNIYVDEILFQCKIHPLTPVKMLCCKQISSLVRRIHRLLHNAIKAGGSTFKDYQNANGNHGRFQSQFQVYGRSNQRCKQCETTLQTVTVAGRTSVFCQCCQVLYK